MREDDVEAFGAGGGLSAKKCGAQQSIAVSFFMSFLPLDFQMSALSETRRWTV